MMTALDIAGLLAAALCFGGMVFFAAITAPMVFIHLNAENAGKLIRAIFPWYYLYVIVTAGIAGVAYAPTTPFVSAGFAMAFLGALYARQGLMPKINAERDKARAGDTAADARFEKLHKLSVRINAVGLAGALVGVVLIAVES